MSEPDGPIVAAVREARAKIMAECDYDLRKLGARLRKIEAELADRIYVPERRRSRLTGREIRTP
jgi:hypothetical protein